MAGKSTRVCPKCRSRDVSHDLSSQAYGSGTIFNSFKCNKCGYSGTFFPEAREKGKKKLQRPGRDRINASKAK